MEVVDVIIVGAGPSGLATSASLNILSISNTLVERDDCSASLWKKRAYDRLHLHLPKHFCHLPHMPLPPTYPAFVPRNDFVSYLDAYASNFGIRPRLRRSVQSAVYDEAAGLWRVAARNDATGSGEVYVARFLVVASGENGEAHIPVVKGLESFAGEVAHSHEYKCGERYKGKSVLVVGCGNSGMEIAYDLANYGAKASIVVRSPFHFLTKKMVHLGMVLLKYLPCSLVDPLILMLGNLKYGDLSKYGICRPSKGPFSHKETSGRSPVIDIGTLGKIRAGEIQVLPALEMIEGGNVVFDNGATHQFDAIVFATGYKSAAKKWLKDDGKLLNEEGMPKSKYPNHWKGKNGLYCVGLGRRGLAGISADAQNIANHIKNQINIDTRS